MTRKNGKKSRKKPRKNVIFGAGWDDPKQVRNFQKQVKKVVKQALDKNTEFKYTYRGTFNIYGGIASGGTFEKDGTGMIQLLTPIIQRGDTQDTRIGSSVRLRRLALSYTAGWPLVGDTPNWQSEGNSAGSKFTRYDKKSLTVRISVCRIEHGDGSLATLSNYLAGFKPLYTFKQNMANAAKSLHTQEVKVLGSRTFKLRRRLKNGSAVFNSAGTEVAYSPLLIYERSFEEGIINIPMNQELEFKAYTDAPVSNEPQNFKYAVVVQFGDIADHFITTDQLYNPFIRLRANYWYTDS